ncbi:MAG: hypothetical protein DMG03_03815 [Acidobacteria bacterium]|nr:MAG: hypothetical protein DMG03_03815 [Acidobacteriota bacterium]
MLSELCVRRPVFATMLVMSLVVLGLFSFRDLGVDLFPRADPATVNVSLALPGASPDEISSSVIEPMEEAISGVSGIDEISARISEGKGNVTVRFVLERDLNDAVNDVREKVAGAIKSVPPELLPPVITKVDPDAAPVMSIMVSSDAMSLRTLTELADKQISRSIQTANGVGQVTIAGSRSREIHIVVDIEKLNSYGLSLTQVRDAIVAENVEIPGGAVEQGKGQLLLRTLGRIDAADDFNNVVVATKNGTPIRVSDIGYAEDSFERRDGREHRRGHRGCPRAVAIDSARVADIGQGDDRRRRLQVHLRVDRFARRTPDLRQPVRRDRRDVLHPKHPRGHHRGAGDSGVDHLVVHAHEHHGVHAEQHDAARHHARRRHRHRRCDRRARKHLPVHRGKGLRAVRCGDSGDS